MAMLLASGILRLCIPISAFSLLLLSLFLCPFFFVSFFLCRCKICKQLSKQANKKCQTWAFFVLKSHTHTHSHKVSDVTKARSYNKGVANILPSPTHPPLEKTKGHCASSAHTQFPSIQSGDPWERTDKSGCLWRAYRMGGGGRISATPPVISLPRLLHTRCTSKRRPIWRATQSHLSAITTTPAPVTFSEMHQLPGIRKLILGPYSNWKPAMKLVSTLKTYPGCWKLPDFWQSHLPMRKETSRRPAGITAFPFLIHHLLTSRFPRCGFWPQELTRLGIPFPPNIQGHFVRMVWERSFLPFYPNRSRKRAEVLIAQVWRRNIGLSPLTAKPWGQTILWIQSRI